MTSEKETMVMIGRNEETWSVTDIQKLILK